MKRKRGGIVSQLLMILLVVVIIFSVIFYDSEFVLKRMKNMSIIWQAFRKHLQYKTLWKLSGENRSDNGL